MPYSFVQIEKDKTQSIGLVFCFLILLYFLTSYALGSLVKNVRIFSSSNHYDSYSSDKTIQPLTGMESLFFFLVAMIASGIHWQVSVHKMIDRALRVLQAQSLNLNDHYHKTFRNILDEVSVATGGKITVEGVVLPTGAMNAFALSDPAGRTVIGVTEGLLARLNRSQLEAVVGHEAAHIICGDCLSTSLISALFAVYSGMLNSISKMFELNGERRSYSYKERESDSGWVFLILVMVVLFICQWLSFVMRMFISRQREYRADAIATRLTRDPVSLAQALYLITHRWRAGGLPAEELEAIFIINPQYFRLDEEESFFAQFFSTHPPIEKRIQVLLDMARMNFKELDESLSNVTRKPKLLIDEDIRPFNQPDPMLLSTGPWSVYHDGSWQGPFDLNQLKSLTWFRPEDWVKVDQGAIHFGYQDPALVQLLQQKNSSPLRASCPKCHLPLQLFNYEGVSTFKCFHCKGVLVAQHDVQRVLIREEFGFSDRIEHLAKLLMSPVQEQQLLAQAKMRQPQTGVDPKKEERSREINLKTKNHLLCPICYPEEIKMTRTFYSLAYPVEVDKCFMCHSTWYDRDELEVLQYLIEKNFNTQEKK